MSPRPLSPAWAYVHDLLERHPNTPSLTLAKKVLADNPSMFTTVEAARTAIRYFRGATGSKSRKHAHTKLARPFDESLFNPFGIPDSDEVEFIPFVLPETCSRILYLSDIHVPYHNIQALTAAIQFGIDKRADTVFIGGDFLDFYSLSTFERDPRQRGFAQELEMGRDLLGIIRREFPDAAMFYQLGNHEERFERYMRVKAPELLSVDEFRIDKLLGFEKLGIELIDGKRVAKVGNLNIVHGHEFGRGGASSSVSPARGLYNRSKTSTICGHHHQTSEHTERDLNGDLVRTYSSGCLCELSPDYMPINRWNHGAALISIDHTDGSFKVDNKRILHGAII
jgi:predicted phosphodiesterase